MRPRYAASFQFEPRVECREQRIVAQDIAYVQPRRCPFRAVSGKGRCPVCFERHFQQAVGLRRPRRAPKGPGRPGYDGMERIEASESGMGSG